MEMVRSFREPAPATSEAPEERHVPGGKREQARL